MDDILIKLRNFDYDIEDFLRQNNFNNLNDRDRKKAKQHIENLKYNLRKVDIR